MGSSRSVSSPLVARCRIVADPPLRDGALPRGSREAVAADAAPAESPVLFDAGGRRGRRLRVLGRAVACTFLLWLTVLALAGLGVGPLANLSLFGVVRSIPVVSALAGDQPVRSRQIAPQPTSPSVRPVAADAAGSGASAPRALGAGAQSAAGGSRPARPGAVPGKGGSSAPAGSPSPGAPGAGTTGTAPGGSPAASNGQPAASGASATGSNGSAGASAAGGHGADRASSGRGHAVTPRGAASGHAPASAHASTTASVATAKHHAAAPPPTATGAGTTTTTGTSHRPPAP